MKCKRCEELEKENKQLKERIKWLKETVNVVIECI